MRFLKRVRMFVVILSFVLIAAGSAADNLPLTLVWTTIDPNGFPLNPRWSYQPSTALLDAAVACKQFPTGVNSTASCSNDIISYDVAQYDHLIPKLSSAFCNLYENPGLSANSVHGHINWRPATMTGKVIFHDYQFAVGDGFHGVVPGDGDYDFFLSRADRSAYVQGNETQQNPGITVEFADRETLKYAREGWWAEFRRSVFLNGPRFGKTAALIQTNAQDGLVLGLLGIDTKHIAHTELHPAYALAIPIADGQGMAWALFARNWGNEGGCSAQAHPLFLPKNKLTLLLPVGTARDRATLHIDPVRSMLFGVNTSAPWGARLADQGLTVTIELPTPSQLGFVYGEIHFCKTNCSQSHRIGQHEIPFDASIVPMRR